MQRANHGSGPRRGLFGHPHQPGTAHDSTAELAGGRWTVSDHYRLPHGASEPKEAAASELQLGRGVSAHMDTAGNSTVVLYVRAVAVREVWH